MWILWKLSFANVDFIWELRLKVEVCDENIEDARVEWNLVETSDGMKFPGKL